MIRVAIIGAGGRMGQMLVRCIVRSDDLKLGAAIDCPEFEGLGQDAGSLAGLEPLGVPVQADLRAVSQADAVVDFTLASAAKANITAALQARKPLVLGTTGLSDDAKTALRDAARDIPIMWSPNMSLGVNLLFSMVKKAGEVLGMDYHVEIDETHHVHKKDAPSGTALKLGEKVAEGRGQDFQDAWIHIMNQEAGETSCPADKIIIRSYREGEVVGDHTVSFSDEGETLELTHHAWSREAFAMGALRAVRWVTQQAPGLYSMEDVLGLKGL